MQLEIVILAAGMGKRMYSAIPKVLHPVAGTPMLGHVLMSAQQLKPQAIHIVVGHGAQLVEQYVNKLAEKISCPIDLCLQHEQLGTAHAVGCALPKLSSESMVLVLYADTPLTPVQTLKQLCAKAEDQDLVILTAKTTNPFGYGRILRDGQGKPYGIVEQKDASPEQQQISEINTGILVAKGSSLKQYLPQIKNNNAQHEFYLTDLLSLLVAAQCSVDSYQAEDFELLQGVNSKSQLAVVERLYQKQLAQGLLEQGLTLADPQRLDVRGLLKVGRDCFVDINCVFEGEVTLGNNVTIMQGCYIKDCSIGDNCVISPYSVLENSVLKVHATVGPFARLRPGSVLEDEAHVGNFVELKKAHLGYNTKAGHLSYLGDADIGANVNIGAGTITCNYDGANKFKTIIEDEVFVGSDTQLVAPVTVAKGVTIAAGTTVTKRTQAPAKSLVLTRAQTVIKENYPRPQKIKH